MSQSTKAEVIELIQRMPDEATLEEIMAELYFRSKVDEGLAELDAGEGIDDDEARKKLSRWLG